jgi:hypothetical protein
MYNAGETFDEAKARGLTDDEAIDAANYVFKEDFKSGAIIDAFQFGLTFGKLFKGAKDVPVDKIAKQVVGK